MLKIEDISFRIGGKTLFESGTVMIPHGNKVGIVGRNGIGKSTLFNLIRGEAQLERGYINFPKKLGLAQWLKKHQQLKRI